MVHFDVLQAIAITSLIGAVYAHGGNSERDLRAKAARSGFFEHSKRGLANCASKMKARGIEAKAIQRRRDLVKDLRKKVASNLSRRNITEALAVDHESNLTGITPYTQSEVFFSGAISCMLVPEITQGPYYVDGEYVRSDLRDVQGGVDLYLDTQFIDTNTCEPIKGAYIDFWHANSTGVYSGIVEDGNGNGATDTANANRTYARGIQPTNADGVAQVISIFPGHYSGRATHIHVLVHQNGTVLPNGTYSSGTISHVGQVFFDQDLISKVEAVSPYSTNMQTLTTNAEDTILASESADGFDPLAEYVLLGDSIEQGVFAWLSFGINASAVYTIASASTLTADGGVVHNLTPGEGLFKS